MTAEGAKRKKFLFVDDDAAFLAVLLELFTEMSHGTWEVFTAENHAKGLAEVQRQRMDVVVLDIGMPGMDGIQFLSLLRRTNPDQQIVMLTGNDAEENRKTCLDLGAALFLHKPTATEDFASIFAALDTLAGAQPQEGFKGIMQRVGLHEVLQFECLARRSSILEIFTDKVRGRIFISNGTIVHADSGALQGEVALYSLLALRGGEFNLLVYTEPPRRTIEGSWEMLLMESARLSDEAAQTGAISGSAESGPESASAPVVGTDESAAPRPLMVEGLGSRTAEIVLCSGAGEVLYDWDCKSLERRLGLMDQIEQQATQLSGLGPVGRFDRIEVLTPEGRLVCQIQPHRRLLVRSTQTRTENP
jgi:CheY-like chemotaxis protein